MAKVWYAARALQLALEVGLTFSEEFASGIGSPFSEFLTLNVLLKILLFNNLFRTPDVYFYPLRPEFVESTYLLYLATRSPFYQHVGLQIIDSLNVHTRVSCGFATVHNVEEKNLEDRMESFFLSETCKYLYLVSVWQWFWTKGDLHWSTDFALSLT